MRCFLRTDSQRSRPSRPAIGRAHLTVMSVASVHPAVNGSREVLRKSVSIVVRTSGRNLFEKRLNRGDPLGSCTDVVVRSRCSSADTQQAQETKESAHLKPLNYQ